MRVLRCLTTKGVNKFSQYLAQLRVNRDLQPPIEILTDPLYSNSCALGDVYIEQRGFASRGEFVEYINQRFVEAGVLADADEPGMWEWLSLFYFDAVCPINRDGERKPGVDGRHLLVDQDARRRNRHLLRGPYMLGRRYNDGSDGELDLLLSYDLPVHGTAATHLVERPRLMSSPGALTAASRLYVNPKSGKPKHGSARKENGVPRSPDRNS